MSIRVTGIVLTIIVAAIMLGMCAPILLAQEHDHSIMGERGQFYESWKTPVNRMPDGSRNISCCSKQDCDIVEYVKYIDGKLWMQRRKDGEWLLIPPEKLEHNYDDARDSPDGFSHMCSQPQGSNVYCAVLGAGG